MDNEIPIIAMCMSIKKNNAFEINMKSHKGVFKTLGVTDDQLSDMCDKWLDDFTELTKNECDITFEQIKR